MHWPRFHNLIHRFTLVGSFLLLASQAGAQTDCHGHRSVERDFFDYDLLLEPDSPAQARARATQVLIRLGHGASGSYLHEQGIRPSQKGAEDLEFAIDGLRELAQGWVSDQRLGIFERRRHARNKSKMGETLVDSGCFADGFEALSRDLTNAPEKRKSEISDRADPNTVTSKALETLDQIPTALLAFLGLVLPLGTTIWVLDRRRRRILETRGYPREIFVGQLTLMANGVLHRVRAADFGRGGTKIHLCEELMGQTKATLVVGKTHTPAIISWENNHFMGISFHTPISKTLLRSVLSGASG